MNKQFFTLFFSLGVMLAPSLYAQVTIGTLDVPVQGSILQLKEDDNANANSTKGLGMPRVRLTNKTNLFPMFESTAGTGIANSNYDNATKKADEDAKHTGLIVYHTDHCTFGGAGLYVWDGTAWEKLGKDSLAKFNLSTTNLDFPSGHDARGAAITPQTFTVSWSPSGAGTAAPTWSRDGLALVPNMTPASGSLSTISPQTMTVQPAAMTPAAITANPFASLSETIRFDSGEPCFHTKIITLHQINYAIQSYNNACGVAGATNHFYATSAYIHLMDTNSKTFRIKSNAGWKTTITNPSNIFSHTIPAAGGADTTDGYSPPINDYTLTGINGTGTKYQTATITIQDAHSPKRANDVVVTCYSCIGTDPALATLPTETSVNSNRADWQNAWGTNVILHEAKPKGDGTNIYEQFTSADFGVAGRWMTTNLSATAYDGNSNPYRSLTGPNSNNNDAYNVAYWAYPNSHEGGPTNPTAYNANKSLGLLYTWDAATAGKGGIDGHSVFGVSPNYELGVNHANPQGICPSGWHLPSDYEWTQLENAIIQKTSQYSSLADINPSDANTLPQNMRIDGTWRGTTHGTAMKDVCQIVPAWASFGASKIASQGGFAGILAGASKYDHNAWFGSDAYFWTSSTPYHSNYACTRELDDDGAKVLSDQDRRGWLFSVRCKKN